jgi:glyoxylase-like metal-dependent hydrolase (beta-lactamase superfamily II)
VISKLSLPKKPKKEWKGYAMNTNLDPIISRRRFLASTSMATTVALMAPRHLFAQDEGIVQTARKTAASATITVQKLRGNVSVLMGAGGNIAVLPGRDGKLLIDAGFAGARPKITEALASISSDPVKHLINTQRTVQLNGTTIALKHYAPAHTDSDIFVHFTEADIFHVADTFWNGYYPFIDYSTGGSIDGMIRATEVNLAKVTDKMIVIPGHGAVGDKSQLAFYRDLLVGTRERVAALKKQGKSLEEIVAAKPTAATDAKWGNGFRSPKDFIGDVFKGV